ncbi:HesA/MoeB/ThiF family protein [Desulfolucanica intricata]|uniref:HesA/MoeB/ThiF family protein n=1 Tax=Desulfolucanica intricata TaxID=1285191 RepID=UPI0008307E27|nr:HesA/MoeB/ThiF family protein [Desulfolucanica intricata]
MAAISEAQRQRYKRNILITELGEKGQKKLLKSSVLIVGAGGLGSPAAYYLAAAGIGHIGLVDDDSVDLSNLQRQILHTTADLGRPKVLSARDKLEKLNPELRITSYHHRLTTENIKQIISQYNIVVDATDNFETRYLINETCLNLSKPFVHGGVLGLVGQVTTFWPGRGPCYTCLFREPPSKSVPTAAELGILGAVAGIIGTIQAVEVVKAITGVGTLLIGRMLMLDAASMSFQEIKIEKDPDCLACTNKN